MMSYHRTLGLAVLTGFFGAASMIAGCSSSSSDAGVGDDDGFDDDDDTNSSSSSSSSGDVEVDAGPTLLPSAKATAIAVGRLHTCALTDGGAVRCWGYLEHGQVGDGTPPGDGRAPNPVQVVGLTSGIVAITAGNEHTCALTAAGGVKCWGSNGSGQLGNDPQQASNESNDSAVPVDVVGLSSGVKAISAGNDHSCALMENGTVKCWGLNDYAQLGDERPTPASGTASSGVPVDVKVVVGATSISAGSSSYGAGHTCAVSGGEVYCWGSNAFGQLGRESNSDGSNEVPTKIEGLTNIAVVAAGFFETCAITTAGGAKCWGKSDSGELGSGTLDPSVSSIATPADVAGLSGVTSLSVGQAYACAIAGGAAKCWGDNYDGCIGNGQDAGFQTAAPVDVTGLGTGMVAISAKAQHACALSGAGAVYCWGENQSGALGNSTIDREVGSRIPVPVLSFP